MQLTSEVQHDPETGHYREDIRAGADTYLIWSIGDGAYAKKRTTASDPCDMGAVCNLVWEHWSIVRDALERNAGAGSS